MVVRYISLFHHGHYTEFHGLLTDSVEDTLCSCNCERHSYTEKKICKF